MHVVVLGANGKVGRLVVGLALSRGLRVTACVHKSSALIQENRLKILSVDIHDGEALKAATKGADAIISALGSWRTPTKDILYSAIHNLLRQSTVENTVRLVTITGADVHIDGIRQPASSKVIRFFLRAVSRKVVKDAEKHIQLLQKSKIRWTVLRSPVMTTWGKKGGYTLSNQVPWPWQSIHRQDVAAALLDLATTEDYVREFPVIFR